MVKHIGHYSEDGMVIYELVDSDLVMHSYIMYLTFTYMGRRKIFILVLLIYLPGINENLKEVGCLFHF